MYKCFLYILQLFYFLFLTRSRDSRLLYSSSPSCPLFPIQLGREERVWRTLSRGLSCYFLPLSLSLSCICTHFNLLTSLLLRYLQHPNSPRWSMSEKRVGEREGEKRSYVRSSSSSRVPESQSSKSRAKEGGKKE